MENTPASTVGELLRKTREARKLSLEDVNRHTRISLDTLRSLEQDDIDVFESEAYLKGFLKNYARFLKLDEDVILLTLDRQRGRMNLGKGTLWDIEETMQEEKLKSPRILSRIVVPILLIIIIILSVLYIREHNRAKQPDQEKPVALLQVEVD
ncbi:MAG: helix-turn-helix domain-containing protein [Candidatus Latescibacteria bacterium]|nr:helix-turn-helix domain-containing protein [Candidatus Latescibacterota bacterium]NIM21049.1 helix-turn-helix domain-containing protein [Candidatus Latescibacterota bacterium]NIM65184.1 helix-turn-helix domain-containing protein [Candidatus Latescibacterota bacterium]NIO01699.1 helix-turn-helix domain-containing protein [Candidatus Latescibacterota bacterium]NIO28216.1 helix-turn-helix domain-containing protein [Candidatus Latescibacterota bacterium]